MVYKINESIIRIQAEALKPIETKVVFWSYDRGTAKLVIQLLRKDNIPQVLSEGTTVPIRLMFNSATAEGGIGKHDYLATIEDRVNGIVSITLEDNILGYVGTVRGSVYINFPDTRSLDTAGRFNFEIRRSPIDETTPELEDYYFNGFSQTIDKIEKIMADGKQEIEQKITESETQIDTKLKDTNDKITKANQDVATLNINIDKANDRIDQSNQQIGDLGNLKRMYSNSIDFGDYDYSGNPNLAPNLKYSDARTSGNATISDNGTSLSYASEVGAVGTVLLPFSPYLPNKTYTLTIKVRLDETSIPSISSFIGVSYSIPSSGAPLYTNIIRTSNMELGVEKTYTHTVTTGDIVNASGWALLLYTAGGDLIKYDLSYEVKLETGSSATPYQPNLLLAPYEISKVALNSNLAHNGMTPIANSNYLINSYPLLGHIGLGDSITITLKGTKIGTNPFRIYMLRRTQNAVIVGNEFLGDMVSVDGLTDTWRLTVPSYRFDDKDLEQVLRVYQGISSANLGAATITWCKIERGLVATPPITFYKYFGEGLKDSNNPYDYSWDVTPEYTEKRLNDKVSLTEPQSIEGTKVFRDQPYIEDERISTEKFGISLTGGLLAGVPIAEWTALNWGSIFAYDNERSKTNDVFTISQDTKTLTILKNCTLQLAGTFTCQTDNSNFYAYLIILVNGANRYRLAGVAGGLNWRNDIGWIATRQFKAGDVLTLVTSTNVKSESISAWGVDQVYIREVITA